MMINGVWKPDVVPTVEEQEAEGALAEAMVDQGYLNFREDHRGQNRRYASKLIWVLNHAGFEIRRRPGTGPK